MKVPYPYIHAGAVTSSGTITITGGVGGGGMLSGDNWAYTPGSTYIPDTNDDHDKFNSIMEAYQQERLKEMEIRADVIKAVLAHHEGSATHERILKDAKELLNLLNTEDDDETK